MSLGGILHTGGWGANRAVVIGGYREDDHGRVGWRGGEALQRKRKVCK